MKILFSVIALFVGASLVQAADAPDKGSTKPSLTSASFVRTATQGGLLEVEAAKLALSKSSNEKIKTFAQRMVTDHGKANEELKIIATRNKVTLPSAFDAEHQAKLDALKSKSGIEFDATYGKDMHSDHQKAVALFRQAVASSEVAADYRAFAAKTLPVLEEHHKLAMQLPQ